MQFFFLWKNYVQCIVTHQNDMLKHFYWCTAFFGDVNFSYIEILTFKYIYFKLNNMVKYYHKYLAASQLLTYWIINLAYYAILWCKMMFCHCLTLSTLNIMRHLQIDHNTILLHYFLFIDMMGQLITKREKY